MIEFERFTLENGLKVIVHEDHSTSMVAMNLLYDVGARDEDAQQTGFAHLFEHLMFGGSKNIPNYDSPLQRAGGENNAFTSNDITNYYLTIPTPNLETGFWLESDRMLELAFSKKSLEVQRNVVIEEFKQRYLNQPYGDVWLLLRPLAYKVHSYQWPTIGKEISHIEEATLEDVKKFFYRFYRPNNAVMVLSGNLKLDLAKEWTEKWFGPIPAGTVETRELKKEPPQTEARHLDVTRDVPQSAIYKAYHMCDRRDVRYHTADLLSDILSRGKSSRLYKELVWEQQLFSDISAFVMGSLDNGLFVVSGKLLPGVTLEDADAAIQKELQKVVSEPVPEMELAKVRNKAESSMVFSEMGILNKAMNLAYFELLGDAQEINQEVSKYLQVTSEGVQELAAEILRPENCSTMYYRAR